VLLKISLVVTLLAQIIKPKRHAGIIMISGSLLIEIHILLLEYVYGIRNPQNVLTQQSTMYLLGIQCKLVP
jgi:hypothetical protein